MQRRETVRFVVTITIPLIPFLIGIGTFFVGILTLVDDSGIIPEFVLIITVSVIVFFASYGMLTMMGMI